MGIWYSRIKNAALAVLRVPERVRGDFLRESVRKNDLSLLVICGIIFVVECYNIARVLFWSRSGLGTLNNRIYFGAYCLLLAIAGLWVLARQMLRRASLEARQRMQYTVILLILAWHVALNAYDLHQDPGENIGVLTTAVLGISIFIQFSPGYALINFGVGYILFQLLAAPLLPAGQVLNLTITFLVALAVSLTNAHHASTSLLQRQQIVQINSKLQGLVGKDPLTGLLNKISVEYQVEKHLCRGASPCGLTFFVIDLDDFKSVNDQYGHPCGDHVLIEAAARLKSVFPEATGLGRIGGDEFAAVLDRALDQAEALAFGTQINCALGDIRWQNQPVAVRCSVGGCACAGSDATYHDLYVQADQALYLAKQKGKGRCCYFRITAKKSRTVAV